MNSITDVCSATMMRRVRRTEVVVVPLLGKEMTAPTLSPLALEATSVTMAASALILDVLACQAESDTHAGSANPLYEARQYSATSHTRQVNRSLYVAPHVFLTPRAVCTVRLLEGASHPDQLKSLTPPRARMNSITDVCSATMMRRVRRTEVVVVPLLGKEMTAPTLSPLALEATSVTMAASALILDVLACQAESDTRADLVLMNNSKSPMAMKIRTGRSRALQSQSPYCFLRCWLGCFSWFEENVRASPCFHHFKFTQKNRLLLKCDSRMRVYLRGSLRFVIPTIHSKHRLLRSRRSHENRAAGVCISWTLGPKRFSARCMQATVRSRCSRSGAAAESAARSAAGTTASPARRTSEAGARERRPGVARRARVRTGDVALSFLERFPPPDGLARVDEHTSGSDPVRCLWLS